MKWVAVALCAFALCGVSVAKDESPVAELVKKHLDSIGSEQARAAVKTRVAEGTVRFQQVNASGQYQDGKAQFVSDGRKMVSLLKLPNPNYHGERFVSDGKKADEAFVTPGRWSQLGQFVRVHNEIFTEGLWGGTLSTGWALATLEERASKLQDRGLKKVDGRELRRIDYSPKKHSDLEIQLYFEPETSRHVMTVYALTISPQMGQGEVQTARQQPSYYRLEERFADFKNVDNLNLPGRWTIQFTSDVTAAGGDYPGGRPSSVGGEVGAAGTNVSTAGIGTGRNPVNQFEVTISNISNNVPLDPKNFEVK
jgi:hypothetical protein